MNGTKLVYFDKIFNEPNDSNDTSALAVLEIDDTSLKATLTYSPEAGMVEKRTAQRQAFGICKTGFLLSNNKRVGAGCELTIEAESKMADRLLQEGYKYK